VTCPTRNGRARPAVAARSRGRSSSSRSRCSCPTSCPRRRPARARQNRPGREIAGRIGTAIILERRGSAPGGCAVESIRARRWYARGSLALVALAFVVLLAFAGRRGLWLVLLTAGTAAVVVAALF